QNEKASADVADPLTVHVDRGLAHALNYRAHPTRRRRSPLFFVVLLLIIVAFVVEILVPLVLIAFLIGFVALALTLTLTLALTLGVFVIIPFVFFVFLFSQTPLVHAHLLGAARVERVVRSVHHRGRAMRGF